MEVSACPILSQDVEFGGGDFALKLFLKLSGVNSRVRKLQQRHFVSRLFIFVLGYNDPSTCIMFLDKIMDVMVCLK